MSLLRQVRGTAAGVLVRGTPRAGRWLGCLALLAMRCAAADAGDSALSAAKREMEALKVETNATRAGISAGGGLPTVALPQMETTPTPMLPMPKSAEPLVERKSSENWLVDAVRRAEKEDKGGLAERALSGGETRAASKGEDDATADRKREYGNSRDEKRAEADQRNSMESRRGVDRPLVVNPLASYMAEWLSPQDHALLQRTRETTSVGQGELGFAGSADVGALTGGYDLTAGAKVKTDPALQKPADNPFIAALISSPVPAPSFASPAPAEPHGSAVQPTPPPPPPVEHRSAVPDFAKPGDDKYFKPLKRF